MNFLFCLIIFEYLQCYILAIFTLFSHFFKENNIFFIIFNLSIVFLFSLFIAGIDDTKNLLLIKNLH